MSIQPKHSEQPFIELNRRFRKLDLKEKTEETAFESYTAILSGIKSGFSWDDLLKEGRVVILGEAGSGKSWELRERVKLLSNRGAFAFFIRLDQLVDQELRTLWDADEQNRFKRWKQSNDFAYFFLDSVDEAKFRKISDFHTTLQRFRNEVGSDSILRSKIFLSSRISEWQPSSDEFEFQRLFPLAPIEKRMGDDLSKKTDAPKEYPLVVHLEPLERDQVKIFASAKGVSNVQEFEKALDDAFAWEFACRPLDVADLIAFWNEKGRIGSLTELIEFDVSSKLRSRSDRVELPLSEEKKREGAEWLAAASVLSRKFSFAVPEDGSADTDSLNSLACLPAQWSADEARALSNRAIFDSAVYGHLRFHHRRVGEYLAAKWITARLEHGCPQIELENILVETVRGRKVLRPASRPIAAWLCYGNEQWNDFVRGLVIATDPRIHLKYGDPANLSIDYRRSILNALAGLSKNRQRIWIESTPDCLTRLASSALSPDIAAHISNRDLATDFRTELLDIVRHGRLVSCVDAAISIIASPAESAELKSHAALAVGAMEDAQILARLFQTVDQLSSIPNYLCTSVVQTLYPKSISSGQLVRLLTKTGTVREFGADLPYFLKAHLQKVLTPQEAGAFLKLLIDLAKTPPLRSRGDKTLQVSNQFWWLGKIIPTVAEILLEKKTLVTEEVETIAQALQWIGDFRESWSFDRDDIGELNAKSLSHVAVRQCYTWRIAAKFRDEHKKEPAMAIQLFDYHEVIKLCPTDFTWLIEDVCKQTDQNNQLLALHFAIEIWDASGRKLTMRWHLRRASRGSPSLRAAFRQSAYTSSLFPIKRFWYSRIRFKYGKWWWRRKFDSVIKCWRWIRNQYVLLRHIRQIESGKRLDMLNFLLHEANEKNSSHWTVETWSGLEKKRLKLLTRATKRGCMAAWRGYSPPLPHEKPERNRTTFGVLIGLTGLKVEFEENPGTFSNLTEKEAEIATRYAMDELNGFPVWFESLAVSHPKAVGQVLCRCVEVEWQLPADFKEVYEVLNKLAWHGEGLAPLVTEKLFALLNAGDPQNYSILRFTLSILMRQTEPPINQLANLAAQRASNSNAIGVKALWLALWMQIDGEAAVKHLQTLLKDAPDPKGLVECLCSDLSGEHMQRGPFVKNPNYLRPGCLRHFIPIVYNYVKISEDIDRTEGGAYTPDARDHAQRFRSVLLDYLSKIEAAGAADFLRELADEPAMAQVRDWILNLLDQKLEREADAEPWTPADLRGFAEKHENNPKNDRELFAIARKRLQVLKLEVEKADNSARKELHKEYPEMELRSWLQRRLLERSQSRYTIPQEAEIDLQQRPDLRLEVPGTGPVSIEVKWADNWTLPELLERLENQLVGQYLRAHNSKFGIFLLGFIGKKQHWEDPATNEKLAFHEVVEIVKQRALSLMRTNPKIAGLEVVSIDFCEPKRDKQ